MIPIRDENPTTTFPFITLIIIFLNIAIFIYQISLGQNMEAFIMKLAVVPYEIIHMTDLEPHAAIPIPATLITSIFLHANLVHLSGNLLYLWIFGNNIEDALGHIRFAIFYLLSGLIATSAHIFANPYSTTPLIGASGAIAGILGAYLVLYPTARIHTLLFFIFFIKIVRIPAAIILVLWFVIQLLNSAESGSGVAWHAHIGGFLGGIFLVKPFMKKKSPS